jgi:ribosome-associated heat shock protein Hsp15
LDRQRIDKWLWHARIVRTRSDAASLANGGQVRINGARIDASSRRVATGDVVTVTLDRVRVLKILAFSAQRGSADATKGLYEDLDPKLIRRAAESTNAAREPGSGRPTKRDRRHLDRLTKHNDI